MKILPIETLIAGIACTANTISPEIGSGLSLEPLLHSIPKQANKNPGRLALKYFFKSITTILRNTHNILVYGGLLITAGLFTPGAWKLVNELAQTELIGLLPKPTNNTHLSQNKYRDSFDTFVQNFKDKDGTDFENVFKALEVAGINHNDSSKESRKVFERHEEIEDVITMLKSKAKTLKNTEEQKLFSSAINFLSDYKIKIGRASCRERVCQYV